MSEGYGVPLSYRGDRLFSKPSDTPPRIATISGYLWLSLGISGCQVSLSDTVDVAWGTLGSDKVCCCYFDEGNLQVIDTESNEKDFYYYYYYCCIDDMIDKLID